MNSALHQFSLIYFRTNKKLIGRQGLAWTLLFCLLQQAKQKDKSRLLSIGVTDKHAIEHPILQDPDVFHPHPPKRRSNRSENSKKKSKQEQHKDFITCTFEGIFTALLRFRFKNSTMYNLDLLMKTIKILESWPENHDSKWFTCKISLIMADSAINKWGCTRFC